MEYYRLRNKRNLSIRPLAILGIKYLEGKNKHFPPFFFCKLFLIRWVHCSNMLFIGIFKSNQIWSTKTQADTGMWVELNVIKPQNMLGWLLIIIMWRCMWHGTWSFGIILTISAAPLTNPLAGSGLRLNLSICSRIWTNPEIRKLF